MNTTKQPVPSRVPDLSTQPLGPGSDETPTDPDALARILGRGVRRVPVSAFQSSI